MPRRFPYRKLKDHFEGIPSTAEWRSLTTITTFGFTHSRKNPALLAIDTALQELDASEATPFDPAAESEAARLTKSRITALLLLGVARAAQVWLEAKATTDSSHRRKWVANLVMNAIEAANSLGLDLDFSPAAAKAGHAPPKQSDSIASVAARLRWRMAREAFRHLGVGSGKKALDPSVWLESNVGGSNPEHRQGHAVAQAFEESGERFAFNLLRKNPNIGGKVKYVAAADRWHYELLVDGRGLLHKRTSAESTATTDATLLDTGGQGFIFVVDGDGKLYCSMGEQPAGQLFHHSSIMSGVAVTFAGAIEVMAGQLTCVDNGSGHYRPGKEHLLNALTAMRRRGVDLSHAKILYIAGMQKVDEGVELPIMETYPDAGRFLDTRGACPHQ